MENLEVKKIEIECGKDEFKTKSFPESGFYLRKVTGEGTEFTDLVFVDKSQPNIMCICPKSVYDGISKISALKPEKDHGILTAIEAKPNGMVSENFVLDFTKILISKK